MNEIVLDWYRIDGEIDWQARAARGAELLDEKRPGWVWDVNLDTLNMRKITTCVIGQLYDEYWSGYRRIAPNGNPWDLDAQLHGFYISDEVYDDGMSRLREQVGCREPDECDEYHDCVDNETLGDVIYQALTEAWKNEITRRRSTAPEREEC